MKEKKKACFDNKCPIHGNLRVDFSKKKEGFLIKKSHESLGKIVRFFSSFNSKYERPLIKKKFFFAHIPKCFQDLLSINRKVFYVSCRPLSKIKKHVILK